MFETGVRQFRLAMSIVWGRRIDARNIERLIKDALATLEEFGTPGDDVQELLEGPFADPKARREFQNGALRRTVRRMARVSPYYRELFAEAGVDPDGVTVESIGAIPVTRKQALVERQRDFLAEGSRPYLSTRTTGTTGRPAEIWLSRYETDVWPAVSALAGLLRGELRPTDCMQINISSRATAAVNENTQVCRLVGARSRVLGLIPPSESVDNLLEGGDRAPTMLTTYPSYLALLVRAARERGLGPDDFHLRRIDCGGEVLSSSLARAGQETFGAEVSDVFGMTEVLPLTGRVCAQGHLHHDLNIGYVEVVDLDSGQPVAPGELGSVAITPYYPYRECMPVLRYDTRDVVRRLPEEPLSCDLAGTPATSRILGKADALLRSNGRFVTTRDIVEVLEALPSAPWPARFAAELHGDTLRLTLTDQVLDGLAASDVERRFAAAGLDARVSNGAVQDAARALRPLRADLIETTFAGRRQ
jgi:phenylacetate-coenzyme A ligase PaaK-like adenylate-forming protein